MASWDFSPDAHTEQHSRAGFGSVVCHADAGVVWDREGMWPVAAGCMPSEHKGQHKGGGEHCKHQGVPSEPCNLYQAGVLGRIIHSCT